MYEYQIKALLDYIDARIEEKLGDNAYRDKMSKTIRVMELREELYNAFGFSE